MGNLCYSPGISAFDRQRCSQGAAAFERGIGPLIDIRREIGRRKAASPKDPEIENLKQALAEKARPIGKEYIDRARACTENADSYSCGFAAFYENYVKFLGKPGEMGRPADRPRSAKLIPLRSGYLVADLTTKGGERREVLFDTGASISGVSRHLRTAESAHLNEAGTLPEWGLSAFKASGLAFAFGEISYSPPLVAEAGILDYFEGTESGKHLVALLGLDYLLQGPVEVNYDNWTLTEQQDVDSRLATGRWKPVSFGVTGISKAAVGVVTRVGVNGVYLPFAVDTGANISSIDAHCLQKLPALNVGDVSRGFIADGSAIDAKDVEGVALAFGDLHITLNAFKVRPRNAPGPMIHATDGVCGTVGLDVLSRFNMIIDPTTFTLFVTPRRSSDEVPTLGGGFSPKRVGEKLVVGDISEDGAAYKGGLRLGDEIVAIDGTSSSKITPLWVLEWIHAGRKKSKLRIRRDGREMDIVIDRAKPRPAP